MSTQFDEDFLQPKITDTLTILVWKLFYNQGFIDYKTILYRGSQLPFTVNINGLRCCFYRLMNRYNWFEKRIRKSPYPGRPGYDYALRENCINPRTKKPMLDFMKNKSMEEHREKEHDAIKTTIKHNDKKDNFVTILNKQISLSDALYVVSFYKKHKKSIFSNENTGDYERVFILNSKKYSMQDILYINEHIGR